MKFSQNYWDSIQRFAETKREIEQNLDTLYLDSDVIEAAKQQRELEKTLEESGVFRAQKLLESMPIQEITAAQQTLYQPSVLQVAAQSAKLYNNITTEIINNQAFVDAIEQSATIKNSLDELARISPRYTHTNTYEPEIDNTGVPEVEPPSPTASIYNQTVEPYEPVREEAIEIQILITNYILASAHDSGELSSDISEEKKKGIRLGLALSVGLLIGTIAFVAIGPAGAIAAGFGSTTLSSQQLESWYGIKRRQRLPEDESE
ncbi:hypothetical protein NP511_17975 [Natrinema thermotolerans]|uniref:Uncharacterized protein n=1 Tax=Natrinema thermotolerans TaxID=121872 RepID=A0AAF0T5D7_9EURY|nr:hypothetical protein [Natrinema thermotolerans]QCC60245.1 hypothetical protein DVR14_17045 [Natrinema thermotolerans]QCC61157.1 hypothetical protein DVR14_21175 [Natrinema thermotolerans]WMT07264.1 hypothetical protein NP511_17975 [Natrinema thermotolerans]